MSYESEMLERYKMPIRKDVEHVLLITLFKHNGVIKEFSSGEDIVNEIANNFGLDEIQRSVVLERIYYKENRIVKSPLWHRLLYRAADSLSQQGMLSNPSLTFKLTGKKEWMLTEKGFNKALSLLNIPISQKEILPVKSYEVQQIANKLSKTKPPKNYNPFNSEKKRIKITRETFLRSRGFRQAVMEAYDYKCAYCGLKMNSPDGFWWEVEAAHIVPNSFQGKDDIWNGLALCRLHHWAFDVGWFTIQNNFEIQISSKIDSIKTGFGKLGDYDFIRIISRKNLKIFLPKQKEAYPHPNAIAWHRENKFYK